MSEQKKECVNCPGATDHDTASCPLMSKGNARNENIIGMRKKIKALAEHIARLEFRIAEQRKVLRSERPERTKGAQGEREAQRAALDAEFPPLSYGADRRDIDRRNADRCTFARGWKARAALAQPSPALELDDQAFDRNAERLTVEAFGSGGGINPHATSIDDLFLDEATAPELERPDITTGRGYPAYSVSQHDRIVGALRAEVERWHEASDEAMQLNIKSRKELRAAIRERDAAQARVAELEKRGSTPEITRKVHAALTAAQKTIFENRFLNDEMYELFELVVRGQKELAEMLAAPVAQAGQVQEEVRILLARAQGQIEHLAECTENLGEDLEDEDVSEDVAEARQVAEEIGAYLAAAPAQGGE